MRLDWVHSRLPQKAGYGISEAIDEFLGLKTISFGFKKADIFFTIFNVHPNESGYGHLVGCKLGIVPTLVSENGMVKDGFIRFIREKYRTNNFVRRINILFEEGTILSPEINTKDGLWHISSSELNLFQTNNIKIFRIEFNSTGVTDYDFPYISKYCKHRPDYLSTAFRLFLQDFASVAKNNYQWEPVEHLATASNDAVLNETDFEKLADFCYVYLMYDRSNGFYKIGVSNNPQYRESTLQSEKPTIEKIVEKRYPSRKIAMAIEASIHKVFDSQRVRGEWFRLGPADVWQIKETLK